MGIGHGVDWTRPHSFEGLRTRCMEFALAGNEQALRVKNTVA